MSVYLRKRIPHFLIVLLGVSLLSFCLIALSGTDPAETIARRANAGNSEEIITQLRIDLGLNASLPQRYISWLGGLFTGEFGYSTYSLRPVSEDLRAYFPATLSLVGLALVWILLLSVPISLLCAHRPNRLTDQLTRIATIFGICLPTFWLGFLLLLAFAVKIPVFSVLPKPGIKSYILPSFALALPVACSFIRLFRASLLGEFHRDYVIYAKAQGQSPGRILLFQVTRNALPPIITLLCQYLGYLIAGSAVVESVFSIKGIGSYLITCVIAADATAVATCILIIATVFVVANLAGDIINRLLCPWMVRQTNG